MKIKEYLCKKYNVLVPTTITRIEATSFGIPFPLQHGWLAKYGNNEITNHTLIILEAKLEKRLEKQLHKKSKSYRHTLAGSNLIKQLGKQHQKNLAIATCDSFLLSYEWRRVRMAVLKRDGARCACCGSTPSDGLRMHVDHIKPRKVYPELALDQTNLQVLCEVCNHGKGNWDMTDWRKNEKEKV